MDICLLIFLLLLLLFYFIAIAVNFFFENVSFCLMWMYVCVCGFFVISGENEMNPPSNVHHSAKIISYAVQQFYAES